MRRLACYPQATDTTGATGPGKAGPGRGPGCPQPRGSLTEIQWTQDKARVSRVPLLGNPPTPTPHPRFRTQAGPQADAGKAG